MTFQDLTFTPGSIKGALSLVLLTLEDTFDIQSS